MSRYQRQTIHKGKMSKCKVCMKRITALDPEYAAKITKSAAAEDKMRKR
jgi:hypothetical protein